MDAANSFQAMSARKDYERVPTNDPAAQGAEGDGGAAGVQALSIEDPQEDEFSGDNTSCSRFVATKPFQGLTAVVIVVNVIMIVFELDDHKLKESFHWPNQALLMFYIFELVARSYYFGSQFLVGPISKTAWNYLDLLVVGSGIFDSWMMPMLPVNHHKGPLVSILSFLRLLRLLRVLKIIRIFLETDLSWTEAAPFQSFIGGVIAFNSLLMGAETDIQWPGWFYIEQVLLVIYVFELSVRIKRFGLKFLSWDNDDITWNVLDFIIVVSSTLDAWVTPFISLLYKNFMGHADEDGNHKKKEGMNLGQVMMLMRMLRLMRILRLVKLVKSVRPLFILVLGVAAALQGVGWVLVLTVVVLYAMGIMATRLIGHGMIVPAGHDISSSVLVPFETVSNSMFTLFRVMTGAPSEEEAAAIDYLMVAIPSFRFAFVFFMVTSSWTLLSILTAVVSENMITTTEAQEEENKIACAEEDRAIHVQELTELFGNIDAEGDASGTIEEKDIEDFAKIPGNPLMLAKKCRVPVRDVKTVLQTLSPNGDPVSMEHFVEVMVEVGNPVTEKSMMKLQAGLLKLEGIQNDSFGSMMEHTKSWRDQDHDGFKRHGELMAEVMERVKQLSDAEKILSQAVEAQKEAAQKQSAATQSFITKVQKSLSAMEQKRTDAISELKLSVQSIEQRQQAWQEQQAAMLQQILQAVPAHLASRGA